MTGYRPGTAVNDGATSSPTCNDLLAIWDGYNGTWTGTNVNGTPSGWQANNYWSATPSTNGHANVGLHLGGVYDSNDPGYACVALQVL